MTSPSQTERVGLLAAARISAATLLTIGRTRLELLGNEIEEKKLRIAQLVMFLLAVVWLVVLFWEARALILGIGTLVFLLIGIYALVSARKATASPDKMFASSLAELEEDVRQLKEAARL
jgi:uncharacterized membrane protein YqjE